MPTEPRTDPRGVRFTAWITSAILAVGLITGSWRVLAVQTALFGMCAFVGLRTNPWGHVYRYALQPRIGSPDNREREDPAPLRFAQGVGFTFALLATVGYAAEWTTFGIIANALALVAALLNAAFGYCIGCRMYLLIRRVAPAGSSPDAP